MSDITIVDIENIEICRKCNGQCCKTMPGIALPEDFGEPLLENLIEAFVTGNWAIDWYEGDPTGVSHSWTYQGLYVRPKIKGVNSIHDPSFGGECVFFTDGKGCSLKMEDRPANCRSIAPIKGGGCESDFDKQDFAIAWMPYHDLIKKAEKRSLNDRGK